MYQALYRKYRPKTFSEVAGQDIIIQTLRNSILSQKINHAYLFSGPRGSGKTSIAKLFAKAVNCQSTEGFENCTGCVCCTQTNGQNLDIIEIDAASNNGVDEIREINNKVNLVPTLGKYKVYIIDEVHMLTIGAFNALLKTLEEPPAHIIFILATTDPQKVPITILSRCQRFDFQKIPKKSMVDRINLVVEKENIDIDEEAVNEIARISDGSLRDALSTLDQVMIYTNQKITIKDIHEVNGSIMQTELLRIVEYLINNDITLVLNEIDNYSSKGKSMSKVTEELIYLIRNIILYKINQKNVENIDEKFIKIANETPQDMLLKYIFLLDEALVKMKKSINAKLILELCFIKLYSDNEQLNFLNKSLDEKKNSNNNEEESKILTDKLENKTNVNNDSKENKLGNQETIKPLQNISKPQIISREINTDDYIEKLESFKIRRVKNVLSKFNKQETIRLKKDILELKDYILDEKMGNFIEMILDGDIKAASEEGFIVVYKTKTLSETFNENIIKLEKIIKKCLNKNYLLISTDIEQWESIKEEFNSKKVVYEYERESITIKDILNLKQKKDDNINNIFGELLEYK